MKVMVEDNGCKLTLELDPAVSATSEEATWACYYALLAAGYQVPNVLDAMQAIVHEMQYLFEEDKENESNEKEKDRCVCPEDFPFLGGGYDVRYPPSGWCPSFKYPV